MKNRKNSDGEIIADGSRTLDGQEAAYGDAAEGAPIQHSEKGEAHASSSHHSISSAIESTAIVSANLQDKKRNRNSYLK